VSTTGRLDAPATRLAVALVRRVPLQFAAWILLLMGPPSVAGARRIWPPAKTAVIGACLVIAAIAAAMICCDAWAFEHRRELPIWLIGGFNAITDYGKSGWFLWPLGVLFVFFVVAASLAPGRVPHLVFASVAARLGFLFTAIALPGLIVTVIKQLIGRLRPSEQGPFQFEPFVFRPEYASMPSGHSTTALAVALAVGALYPRLRPILWIYAALIVISRVVIGAHYPSDVLAGAVVGAVGALAVRNWFAVRRLGFAIGPNRSIHALPAPLLRCIKRVARRKVRAERAESGGLQA
jgi:membrane-associated phospholipid phosphatase